MNKDVIYVDTDDDITSVIEKVKNAKEHVVALVPPKRVGVLQSAVNLKLLLKTAGNVDKRLVLITTDPALTALAAGVQLPVAKNLQSKPEVVDVEDEPVDDDVINGEDIAVGELAVVAASDRAEEPEDKEVSAAVAAIAGADAVAKKGEKSGKGKKAEKSKKIPNYNKFRKRLLIFGSLGVVLVAFLVWAIWFAPKATITVTAKTNNTAINVPVALEPSTATNVEQNILQPVVKQVKKTNTVDFDATGSKEIGESAKGSIVISNCEDYDAISLPAGTVVASGSMQYTLNSAVTVPGGAGNFVSGCTRPGVSSAVNVTAANIGPEYNIAAGTTLAIAGHSSSLSAKAQSAFTGGSKETVTIVQQSDVDKATDALKRQDDTNKIKTDLISQMGEDVTPLQDSFTAVYGGVSSNPAVGQQTKRAQASIEVTYTMIGISNKDLNDELDAAVMKSIDNPDNQRIYDNGFSTVQFKDFAGSGGGAASVRIVATAQVGPKLDEQQIKNESQNKRAGEIQEDLSRIPGVQSVNVDLSPFWVSKTPDADRITVKFSVNE